MYVANSAFSVSIGLYADANRRAKKLGHPETFDYLDFMRYCRKTGNRRLGLERKPAGKRVRCTLLRIKGILRSRLDHDLHEAAPSLAGGRLGSERNRASAEAIACLVCEPGPRCRLTR